MSPTLDTPVLDLSQHGIARLGAATARRLALALANVSGKGDASEVSVEDLLNYLPMRYEDRSNLARIESLRDGVEASLELYVRVAGGFQVGKNRRAPPSSHLKRAAKRLMKKSLARMRLMRRQTQRSQRFTSDGACPSIESSASSERSACARSSTPYSANSTTKLSRRLCPPN